MTRAKSWMMRVTCCLSAFAVSACATNESVECAPCKCGASTGVHSFDEELPDMTAALQLFGVAEESAIIAILQIAESPRHEVLLRVCDMSEEQWVAHWGDAWEKQRDILIRRLGHLRFLANQIVDRAVYLKSVGETDKAVRLLNAVKRLGAANRGTGVPKVCDLVGKAIEELADRNLATKSG